MTISKKQENKGMRGILDLIGTLSQQLKTFDGVFHKVLPETDGLTVETWLAQHGVVRFVTPKGVKKGITPALFNAGVDDDLKAINADGKVMANYIYKNVVAKIAVSEGDKDKMFRVFASEEDALKEDGKAISIYKKVEIDCSAWSGRIMLKELQQSQEIEKHQKKAEESEVAWTNVDECWILRWDAETKTRKAVKVRKEDVVF